MSAWSHRITASAALPLGLTLWASAPGRAQERGEFEGATDVGDAQPKGSVRFDPGRREYRITGGGDNMWAARDAFHYAWRRLSGDLTLTAEVGFPESEGNAHRKAGWVVRHGLEPDSPYADAIVHADGLISLHDRLLQRET